MSLEQSVHNYTFRGTLINGVVTITGYAGIYGTGITVNCLRGMCVILNNVVNDYPLGYIPQGVGGLVVSNTAWADGGFTANIGGGHTIQGLAEISFVFPVGRLAINTAAISSKSQPALPSSNSVCISTTATPPLPTETKAQVITRGAPDCLVISDYATSKLRGGERWESS